MSEVDIVVGACVRLHREQGALGVDKVAASVHVSDQVMTAIEAGQLRPGPDTLFRVAEALGVSLVELFDGLLDDDERATFAGKAAPRFRT